MAAPLPCGQDCLNAWIHQKYSPASSQHGAVLHPPPVAALHVSLETHAGAVPGPGLATSYSGEIWHTFYITSYSCFLILARAGCVCHYLMLGFQKSVCNLGKSESDPVPGTLYTSHD